MKKKVLWLLSLEPIHKVEHCKSDLLSNIELGW
jgi:hypothetical protein